MTQRERHPQDSTDGGHGTPVMVAAGERPRLGGGELNRTTQQRRMRTVRAWTVTAALASMGIFFGLVAGSGRGQRTAPPPSQQVSRLEDYLGYPFWDTSGGKAGPPQYVPTPGAATTRGS